MSLFAVLHRFCSQAKQITDDHIYNDNNNNNVKKERNNTKLQLWLIMNHDFCCSSLKNAFLFFGLQSQY